MTKIRKHAPGLLLLLTCLLALLAAAGCSGGSTAPVSTATGASSPDANEVKLDFSLPTPGGGSVDLKQYDDSIRVVDFWATWCPPCREAIPHLNEIHRKYKDRGVNVLGFSVDDNPKVLAAFDQEVHIEYASMLSTRQAEEAFGGVAGLPSTFILDRRGRVYKSYVGQIEPETVEEDIKALLAAQ